MTPDRRRVRPVSGRLDARTEGRHSTPRSCHPEIVTIDVKIVSKIDAGQDRIGEDFLCVFKAAPLRGPLALAATQADTPKPSARHR
jgi:hypothetical protein